MSNKLRTFIAIDTYTETSTYPIEAKNKKEAVKLIKNGYKSDPITSENNTMVSLIEIE